MRPLVRSHPGPTFPNRFYYLSGHLATDASGEPQRDNGTSSLRLLRSRTIQDALTERGISWKMYESGPDVCMLRMFARYAFDDTNIRPIEEFFASAKAGALPSVSFIEPNYHLGKKTDDDHPPTDMAAGQKFVQSVYAALTSNAVAWEKTLFIVTYDEHGGLHDHHVPDLADRYIAPGRLQIDIGYGVRVPAFIISPWVPAGVTTRRITQNVFDHTSILKTIVNRFMPTDPAIMSDRMAFANDLFPLLTLEKPRPPVAMAMPADVLDRCPDCRRNPRRRARLDRRGAGQPRAASPRQQFLRQQRRLARIHDAPGTDVEMNRLNFGVGLSDALNRCFP